MRKRIGTKTSQDRDAIKKEKEISPVAIYVWCSYGKAVRDFDLVFFAGTLLCMDGVDYGEGLRSLERVVAVGQGRPGQTCQSDGSTQVDWYRRRCGIGDDDIGAWC